MTAAASRFRKLSLNRSLFLQWRLAHVDPIDRAWYDHEALVALTDVEGFSALRCELDWEQEEEDHQDPASSCT